MQGDRVAAQVVQIAGATAGAIHRRWLKGPADYLPVWQAMRDFTETRGPDTPDHIWLVEHTPVYTLGQAGKREHILHRGDIAVVPTDRGGQATYHGPGQILAYCLIDLHRRGLFVKPYVATLEDAILYALAQLGITNAHRQPGAPGVYVPQADGEPAKIAALGIKVRNGCTYHGVALNVAMDLAPFLGINPCGYAGLRVVDLASCGVDVSLRDAGETLAASLCRHLSNPLR